MSEHPWQRFLDARADVIDWLKKEGDTDERIAIQLSMDANQVRMIRERDRSNE